MIGSYVEDLMWGLELGMWESTSRGWARWGSFEGCPYLMFDAAVFTLGVFSDRHQVDILIQRIKANNRLARPHIGVQVEFSATRITDVYTSKVQQASNGPFFKFLFACVIAQRRHLAKYVWTVVCVIMICCYIGCILSCLNVAKTGFKITRDEFNGL